MFLLSFILFLDLLKLEISNLEFSLEWFDRLFVGVFDIDIVLRIFDWYFS